MRKILICILSLTMFLPTFQIAHCKESQEEITWDDIYQEVYNYAIENGLDILPDGGIVISKIEENQAATNSNVNLLDYNDDGNGGYGNVTMQVVGTNGIYYYWSHSVAPRYINSIRNQHTNIVKYSIQAFADSITAYFVFSIVPSTAISTYITSLANSWYSESLTTTQNRFRSMCNEAEAKYNSTFPDQGIVVYWKSDYSGYVVGKQ